MKEETAEFKSYKLKYKTFASQIVEQIDEMIALGHLAPGDPLPPERDLAKRFGVSRPTINEALSILESQGVIVRKIGSGTFISQEIPESILSKSLERFVLFQSCSDEDLVVFRETLEPEIAALAAEKATPQDVARLKEALEAIEKQILIDPDHQAEVDVCFHLALAEASKNKLFISVIAGIRKRIETWIYSDRLEYMEQGLQLHREVYRAVEAKDPVAARKAMANHMRLHRKVIGMPRTSLDPELEKHTQEEVVMAGFSQGAIQKTDV